MSQTKAQLIDPVDGSLVNADINASAAIAGTKISPDFGSQAISTTGGLNINGASVFNETGANVDFRIEGDTDTRLFFLDAGLNKIGIGVDTAPLSKLHVQDVEGTTLTLGNTAAAASDGDYLSGIDFHIKDNNDGTGATCASIRTFADQNHTATAKGTALALFTVDDDTTTLDERLRIIHNGNVGIGTTSPDQLLHINKSSGTTLYKASVAGNSTIGLEIVKTGSTTQSWRIVDGQTTNGKLEFYDVTDSATRMCIDGDGKVGIKTTSPIGTLDVFDGSFVLSKTGTGTRNWRFVNNNVAAGNLGLQVSTATDGTSFENVIEITKDGNVGIGADTPASDGDHYGLTIAGRANSGAGMITFQDSGGTNDGKIFADDGVLILFADPSNSSGSSSMVFRVDSSTAKLRLMSTNEGFRMGGASDITFDQLRVASGTQPQGCIFRGDGSNATSTSNQGVYRINRTSSDGTLINFLQNGTTEGSISVSGSSVAYNGGHLSRWSQLSGISSTDKSARPTIYQGTVMSNLDELCTWTHADLLYKEDILYMPDETLPEGKSAGDIKHAKGDVLRAGYTEENQQLNMTKVSDTEGDKDVAGVFWAWDDDDDEIVNDFYIAMTGDLVIRVAASTTIARGDLMISAGDGTAKPQADDIIRSSTIAKIISTNHTATYADGSKAYPCVLMAC